MTSQPSGTVAKLGILAAVSLASLYLAFFGIAPETGFDFLRFNGPTFLTVLIVAFIAVAIACYWPKRSYFPRISRVSLALLLLASVFTATQEPPRFKVLQDDVVLSSIAMNIHLNRLQEVPSGGHLYGGRYHLSDGYLDKRAALYSTLVALVHDLTGYRIENAFYLNQVLTALVLGLLFLFVLRVTRSESSSILAVWLFATIPIVLNNATGGGFEVLNLALILALLHAGLSFWQRADDSSLILLCLSAVLLAYVRYESILFVFMAATLIGIRWWQNRAVNLPWQTYFVPLAMIPAVLQLNVSFTNEALWQLEEFSAPFSTEYVMQNLGAAVSYLTSTDATQSNSPLAILLGLPALIVLLYRSSSNNNVEDNQFPGFLMLLFALTILFQFGLILHFFAGNLEIATATRYVLPLYLLLSISTGLFLHDFAKQQQVTIAVGMLLVFSAFLFTLPATSKQAYSHAASFDVRTNWILEQLQETGGGHQLLIHPRPWVFALHKVPVTQNLKVNGAPWQLAFHFESKTFDKVLVAQEFAQLPGQLRRTLFGSELSARFELKEVARMTYSPYQFVVISEVLAVKTGESVPANENTAGMAKSKGIAKEGSLNRARLDPEMVRLWKDYLP